MAIALTGTGSLFVRLGKIIKALGHIRGCMGFTNPDPASAWGTGGHTIIAADDIYDAIQDQYEATLQDAISGLYADQAAYQQGLSQRFSYFQALAQNTLIRMAHNDTPLPALTLANAMDLLISQMTTSGDDVDANVVGVTAAATAGNIGDPKFVSSVVGADGKNLEYVIAEVIHAKATTDANNGATAGFETLTLSSTFAITDPLDRLWPGGSGASGTLQMCNNTVDASSADGGNILTNSDMEVFTVANLPDNFVRITGTLGTSILKSTLIKHRGTSSVSFVGDAAELTQLDQEFDATAGTVIALEPQTVYALSVWLYNDVDPAAGVLTFSLVDGADAIVADDAGTANTISSSLPGLTPATWTNVTGFFRTPTNIPATMKLRIKLTTALSAGTITYIDDLAMCKAVQVYTGGPYVAIFHGLTDILIDDDFTATVTNTHEGTFQIWAQRLFDMRGLGMQLPSDTGGGETIADSLTL